MAVEMIVLNPCTCRDGILWTPRSSSTMQHTVVKDDHITGLCGDPTGTGEGQPLPHHHPTNGRERFGAPSEPAEIRGDEPGINQFEPRFSVGLSTTRCVHTYTAWSTRPSLHLAEGAVDVVAVPSREE